MNICKKIAISFMLIIFSMVLQGATVHAAELYQSKLSPDKAKVIVIDPGHCDSHGGAIGYGLKEQAIVIDIANYCKSVLDQYGDVTVYMTREDGTCCEALAAGSCLQGRSNYAKRLDADFLVSMHINAGGSNGANVLAAYESGYNDEIRIATQKFGHIVLKNLSALGIANRGLLLRKSENGTRYENGKLSDYYSIVYNGVVNKIPAVIIEHGYITSFSDCQRFFRTTRQRNILGLADAKSIISYYGLNKKTYNGELVKSGDATYFVASNNRKVAGWVKKDGKWYYFDTQTGAMKTGFTKINNKWYFLSPATGEMVTGWFSVDGYDYLAKGDGSLVMNEVYDDGLHAYIFTAGGKKMTNRFVTMNGSTYYVTGRGYVCTGIVNINGKAYAFDEDGRMQYGCFKLNGKIYYADPSTGVLAIHKIVTYKGERYYFGRLGYRQTGKIALGRYYYYFHPSNGRQQTGWVKIGNYYYYFKPGYGEMARNEWIGNRYVNAQGILTKTK